MPKNVVSGSTDGRPPSRARTGLKVVSGLGGAFGLVLVMSSMLASYSIDNVPVWLPFSGLVLFLFGFSVYTHLLEVSESAPDATELAEHIHQRMATPDALASTPDGEDRTAESDDVTVKLANLLVDKLDKDSKRARRREWMFLWLGALISFPMGILVNHLS